MGCFSRWSWVVVGVLLGLAPVGVWGQEASGPETAGWHVLRPGEDLQSVASFYLPRLAKKAELGELNPRLSDPQPGDRVLVKLLQGLPGEAALVGKLAGRVESQPAPVSWLRSRRFDLLTSGDSVRTFPSSSVEMRFADATRLVLTEDSLVFLHGQGSGSAADRSQGRDSKRESEGDIEILEGQGDLLQKAPRRPSAEPFEVVVGPARVETRANRSGSLAVRVRKRQDAAQVMVYEGSSQVRAAGGTVEVKAGQGSVISAAGKPLKPEALLPAPVLRSPGSGQQAPLDLVEFQWLPVTGARSYVLEICLDAECSELVWRLEDVKAQSLRWQPQAPGRYSWRVTARAPSELDGFPAKASPFHIEAPPGWGREASSPPAGQRIAGEVRSHPDALPLPGALVRVVELGLESRAAEDGSFEIGPLPTGTYTVEAHLPGFVVGQTEGVGVLARRSTELRFFLQAAPLMRDEIVVRPSQVSFLQEGSTPVALSREEILALPQLGDDIFRALPALPGTAANDVSAEIQVRGGRRDEVQILLDGQELYAAYHLKDFDNALSLVSPATLDKVELMTGAFPAQFGDRMGAVLQLTSQESAPRRWQRLGISMLHVQAGVGGPWAGDRGHGFLVARRGSLDLVGKFFGPERPSFWDLFAKGTYQWTSGSSLSARGLVARDDLDFQETVEGDFRNRSTHHGATYGWLEARTLLSSRLLVENAVAWSDFDSRREALELEVEQDLQVQDRRGHEVVEGRTAWSWEATPSHLLSLGAAYRDFQAQYDYFNERQYAPTTIALIRSDGGDGRVRFADRFDGGHASVYAADRFRLGERWTVEVGGRYDRYSLTAEGAFSPRLSGALRLGERSLLRAAWGRFQQSQRPYELLVEDGETQFQPVERAEHGLVGLEHLFSPASRLAGASLRIEAYRREIPNPRSRTESLYEIFNTFPELEPDRLLFTPQKSRAEGVEALFRGPTKQRFSWWLAYSYSRTEDRIDGRWVPRLIDQRHALNLNLALQLPRHWALNLVGRGHTGWPTTPLRLVRLPGPEPDPEEDPGGEVEDGEMGEMGEEGGPGGMEEGGMAGGGGRLVPVLGEINSLRLPSYYRLDLRLSRRISVAKGALTFFLDVQNALNRKNLGGFDYVIDEEAELLEPNKEFWPGFFPSVGLTWEF